MAQLAIQGHSTRGSEVIALLEMLGGVNTAHFKGEQTELAYYIEVDRSICCIDIEFEYHTEFYKITLEQFKEKFPYKVGDKVTLDKFPCEIKGMSWEYDDIIYYVKGVDFSKGVYSKDKDLQPYKEETMEDKSNLLHQLKEYFNNTPREVVEKEWHEYDKYNEIGPKVNEYLEYVNNIRQPKYPKTYEECCDILQLEHTFELEGLTIDEEKLTDSFIRLKRCRDAYWKIAGEQMGLNEPWKPDWKNNEQGRYMIMVYENKLYKDMSIVGTNFILVFPTEEMRDAFCENFKDLIEQCKELL